MAVRALASVALVHVAAGTINLAISDCGDSATHGHVTGISPKSVKQNTVVTVSGHLDITVSDGSFDINVKAAGVSVQSCKGDLCSASKCSLPAGTGSVDFHGVACPLAAGDVSLDFDVKVSRFVPSSLANLDIEITSEGSAGKLLCAKISTSPGTMELEDEDLHVGCRNDSECSNGEICTTDPLSFIAACNTPCTSDSDCVLETEFCSCYAHTHPCWCVGGFNADVITTELEEEELRVGCKKDSECSNGEICTTDPLSFIAACHTPCSSDSDCPPGVRCACARGGPCWCVGSLNAEEISTSAEVIA